MANITSPYPANPAAMDSTLVEPAHTVTSWGAILGGAVAAAAISVILLTLGSGLGLVFGPHGDAVSKAKILGFSAIAWLILIQWISSGFGGYLAGRLRSRWVRIHADECYFRDTAHGFLAWAVATLFTAVFFSSALSSMLHGGMHAAAMVNAPMGESAPKGEMAGPANGAHPANGGPFAYYVDSLFRSENANATVTPDVKMEADRIIMTDMKNADTKDNAVTPQDKSYLTHLVSARTGLSQADASARVDTVLAQIKDAEEKAKTAAESARKAAATLSFFTFFSLLIGAFIASVAGAIGGHQRNTY